MGSRQVVVAQESGAAVEGDGSTRRRGQSCESVADRADDALRAPVAVWDETEPTALAFDQRGHVGLAVCAAEDQQVGFPVPDLLAPVDLGRTLGDRPCQRDFRTTGLAAKAATPQPPGAEQVAVERQRAAFRAVDELVDRLVAQTRTIAGELQAAGDRLGRPAELELLDDVGRAGACRGRACAAAGGGAGRCRWR